MWRSLRLIILLVTLAVVALGAWRAKQRTTAWTHTLHAVVFPINGDASATSARYLSALKESDFDAVEAFIEEEARRYGNTSYRPIDLRLAAPITPLPPASPKGTSIPEIMLWSLQLRWWAWQHDTWQGARPDIRLYVLYHDPDTHASLGHSTGLEKGQMALIKAYASPQDHRSNLVILTHEMLHTLGASDKYDPRTLHPVHPEGYAEPQAQPRHPQRWAEIMGGRLPLTADSATIPTSLNQTLIGPATAREIGLSKPPKKERD